MVVGVLQRMASQTEAPRKRERVRADEVVHLGSALDEEVPMVCCGECHMRIAPHEDAVAARMDGESVLIHARCANGHALLDKKSAEAAIRVQYRSAGTTPKKLH